MLCLSAPQEELRNEPEVACALPGPCSTHTVGGAQSEFDQNPSPLRPPSRQPVADLQQRPHSLHARRLHSSLDSRACPEKPKKNGFSVTFSVQERPPLRLTVTPLATAGQSTASPHPGWWAFILPPTSGGREQPRQSNADNRGLPELQYPGF